MGCGQGFMPGRSLNAHLGNCGKKKPKKKPNLSTHRCTVCEKIFNRKCNLERHMKMHNGEKDYSCHNVERSLPITEAFQIAPIRNMNLKMLNYSHSDKLGVKSNENKMYIKTNRSKNWIVLVFSTSCQYHVNKYFAI